MHSDKLEKDTILFGHLFSLSNYVPLDDCIVKLTGSNYFTTAPFLIHLMEAYLSHCETNDTPEEQLSAIRQVREMTIKAMHFFDKMTDSANYEIDRPHEIAPYNQFVSSLIEESKHSGVEVLTGWEGHAISLVIKGDDFYRNNGGGCANDTATEHYKITNADSLTSDMLKSLYRDRNQESNKTYIQQDLHHLLGLQFKQKIDGEFQTVGNCSLHSMLIALKVKYRLFLPADRADSVYADTLKFFEQFYLNEYLSRHAHEPLLPHLLMRLIIQRLLPRNDYEGITQLIQNYFVSHENQEILHEELLIHQWRLEHNSNARKKFEQQIQLLGIDLNALKSPRLQLLNRFLTDHVDSSDLELLKSWPDQQLFQGNSLVHFAVRNNNVALVSSLLQINPDWVDTMNWQKEEPLCLVQSVEMVELLVDAGADVTSTETDNALDMAIRANKVDLVLALLKHGAQPSEYSAYHAIVKDPKIFQSLAELHPESITKPVHSHRTAIHVAAANGLTERVSRLIYENGLHPDSRDINGITPLQLALQHGHNKTAISLINYPGMLFAPTRRGDSVIDMAKSSELKQSIETGTQQKIAEQGAFAAFKTSDPGLIEEDLDYLILAIRTKNVPAIRGYLLTYPQVKVTTPSKLYGLSPLTEAIRNLHKKTGQEYEELYEIIHILLKTPCIDINARMSSSEPMLFMATSIGDARVLELFLADPKLNPNQQDNLGYTALHDAVERGHVECVHRLLQDERIDTTIVTKRGQRTDELPRIRAGAYEKEMRREKCIAAVREYQQRKLSPGNAPGI